MSASVTKVAVKLGSAALGIGLAMAAFGVRAQAPELAAQAPADQAAPDAAAIAKGRELFTNYGCGSCHALKDAGGEGHVGPALDGNPNLTHDLVVNRVTNGSGPMPAFDGQMSKEEIEALAHYVTQVAAKP